MRKLSFEPESYITDNLRIWNEKSLKYPFHMRSARGLVKPDILDKAKILKGHFLAVPFEDHVRWAFANERDRDLFIELYGGEIERQP